MPTTYAKAFAALAAHAGKPMFLHLAAKTTGLKPGAHKVTIFDWSALEKDERSYFTESQTIPLFEELGRDWHAKLAPFAIVGSENHPLEDFDEQCDLILLFDLEAGDGKTCPIVAFAPPDGMGTSAFAASAAALDLRPR
jgi:hypothetical protein